MKERTAEFDYDEVNEAALRRIALMRAGVPARVLDPLVAAKAQRAADDHKELAP